MVDDVSADEGFFRVGEDAGEVVLCDLFEEPVDFFCVGCFLDFHGEHKIAAVRCWYAQGIPVEFAVEGGHDVADGFGGAGAGGDDVFCGGSCAAEVFLVRPVNEVLVCGVAVRGYHDASFDGVIVVQDFGEGGQAVGGAAGVGDNVVFVFVVLVFIDAEDDGNVRVFGWRGDEDFFGAGGEVLFGVVPVAEEAGAFEDDVDVEVFPGELAGFFLRKDFDGFAVDDEVVFVVGYLVGGDAVDAVVFEEVGECFRVG